MAQQRTIVELQPAGMISSFCASSAPSGWLECNGAAISRTTYADTIYSAVGIIDAGYRGEVKAMTDNIDHEDDSEMRIDTGTRMFQICQQFHNSTCLLPSNHCHQRNFQLHQHQLNRT